MHHADRFVELAPFDIVFEHAAGAFQHLRERASNFAETYN